MTSIKDRLKAARPAEKVVPVCLRGDLAAKFDRLRRELEQLPEDNDSLAAGGDRRRLRDEMERLREEMAESTVDFRMRALPRARWSELGIKFPPRDDVPGDKLLGVNEDEFAAAIVREGLVEPVLDEEDWATLEESLTYGQWTELGNAAWTLNRQTVNVPFLPSVSPNPRNSASG